MTSYKSTLKSGTVIPAMMVAAGLLAAAGPNAIAKPRLETRDVQIAASPCNPCAARNPCAAKNPCAANNPCNPCGAKNPCNPCAAGGSVSSKCVVPRLQSASANPCAAKNPCNPCAAKNPCNPCAAGGGAPELTRAEAKAVYDCLVPALKSGYGKSGDRDAASYAGWKTYNNQPYISGTHGGRFVNNYANRKARAYGKFEKAGRMPPGAVLAKDSFTVNAKGRAGAGPFFLMEKMGGGFNKVSGDWKYTLVMPNGKIVGKTNGSGSANVKFCYECHMSVAGDQDSMMLMPDEFRKN